MESEKFSAFSATERDGQDKRDAPKPKSPKFSPKNIYNGENGPPILQNMETGKISGFRASEQDNGKRRNDTWMDENRK
jgi:hypothetical protein